MTMGMHPVYRRAITRLHAGHELDRELVEDLCQATLTGQLPPAAAAAWLTAVSLRDPSAAVVAGVATALRAAARRVRVAPETVAVGGTGGSGLATLNVSTLAAFVCAAAGVPTFKATRASRFEPCSSGEVLGHLGARLDLSAEAGAALAATQTLCVLDERTHHPALAGLDGLRRALGFATVLDLALPLAPAADVRRFLVGITNPAHGPAVVAALKALGARRAMVVAGEGGVDEVALNGPTRYWELWEDGSTHRGVLTPEDMGLRRQPFVVMRGGAVAHNAERFVAVARGETGAATDWVAFNAAAALYVAGAAPDLESGLAQAQAVLRSGAVYAAFEAWRDATQGDPEAVLAQQEAEAEAAELATAEAAAEAERAEAQAQAREAARIAAERAALEAPIKGKSARAKKQKPAPAPADPGAPKADTKPRRKLGWPLIR
jgi:anthranilate phosphoribosyltransferase